MRTKVKIDARRVYLTAKGIKRKMNEGLKRAQREVESYWKMLARQSGTRKKEYLSAIKRSPIHSFGEPKASVFLDGKVANLLETGFNRYDMKPGLLARRGAKTGKGGQRYVHVPVDSGVRTLSTRTVRGWFHPGLKGLNLAPKVRKKAKEILRREVKRLLGR